MTYIVKPYDRLHLFCENVNKLKNSNTTYICDFTNILALPIEDCYVQCVGVRLLLQPGKTHRDVVALRSTTNHDLQRTLADQTLQITINNLFEKSLSPNFNAFEPIAIIPLKQATPWLVGTKTPDGDPSPPRDPDENNIYFSSERNYIIWLDSAPTLTLEKKTIQQIQVEITNQDNSDNPPLNNIWDFEVILSFVPKNKIPTIYNQPSSSNIVTDSQTKWVAQGTTLNFFLGKINQSASQASNFETTQNMADGYPSITQQKTFNQTFTSDIGFDSSKRYGLRIKNILYYFNKEFFESFSQYVPKKGALSTENPRYYKTSWTRDNGTKTLYRGNGEYISSVIDSPLTISSHVFEPIICNIRTTRYTTLDGTENYRVQDYRDIDGTPSQPVGPASWTTRTKPNLTSFAYENETKLFVSDKCRGPGSYADNKTDDYTIPVNQEYGFLEGIISDNISQNYIIPLQKHIPKNDWKFTLHSTATKPLLGADKNSEIVPSDTSTITDLFNIEIETEVVEL